MSADDRGLNRGSFRRRHNEILGVMSEVAAPLLRAGAAALSRGRRSEPTTWRRGLILGHNHLGDVLYRTCSLPSLRHGLPACEWSYLTSPNSAAVLDRNPHLAEVLPWNHGDDSWNLAPGRFGQLRERRFDVVLCTNTLRYYPDLILAAALGIPNRVGFVHKGLSGLINHPSRIEFPNAYASYFRSMVASVTGAEPTWALKPEVYADAAAEADAAAAAKRFRQGKPIVSCVLTTRQREGNWPADWMVAALRKTRDTVDFDIALCGGAGDRERLVSFAGELGSGVSILAGELSVRGFAAFLRRSASLFTLDSGPRHIGNAVGLPVVFARNMSHSRIEAGKYCETETDIAPEAEYQTDAAIRQIAAAQSLEPAARLLAGYVESAGERPD